MDSRVPLGTGEVTVSTEKPTLGPFCVDHRLGGGEASVIVADIGDAAFLGLFMYVVPIVTLLVIFRAHATRGPVERASWTLAAADVALELIVVIPLLHLVLGMALSIQELTIRVVVLPLALFWVGPILVGLIAGREGARPAATVLWESLREPPCAGPCESSY